ncbi:TetR/AcrR family transcriptional regulator [Isoptericola sp. 4D.3]|uniref:TetR/AcrR family transcriptional regulator n=1 Tax=Isoptericola peretonis TaxID=2918523 RepID=A0ABT0J0M5_9MICO|nr:TetR/AcrR family transcriptional regulator [Isoptericola sp. 4D.3]
MASLSASDWVRAAARRLAADGVDAVRVEPLARDLGVSKGSFYWHFADRAALLDAVLEHWRTVGTAGVITRVEEASDDPADRLLELARLAFEHAGAGPGGILDGRFDGAVRAWAAKDVRARDAVHAVDGARTSYLERLLAGAGAPDAPHRAALLYRALLGEYAMRNAGAAALDPRAVDALAAWALGR